MHYRPEIDGLRAVAVVPVILFHAGFGIFSGGFVGVDVFFVISGFLITSILQDELRQGRFSILGFYERRARRILPALFVVMAFCAVLAWFWMLPDELENFGQSLVATAAFSNNVLLMLTSGYWALAAEFKPLLHTWSLGVEEQFYVIFPLILFVCWRLWRRHLALILGVILLVSLAAAQWGIGRNPTATFFLLHSRGWELLLGALAALWMAHHPTGPFPPRAAHALGLAGLALILGAVLFFDSHTPTPSLITLIPTLGAVLIILAAQPGTPAKAILASPPVRGIGLISYSAYLWHFPLFAFARIYGDQPPGVLVSAALSLLTLGLAWASWRFVEAPFRRKDRFSRLGIYALSALFSGLFLAFGLFLHLQHGVPARLYPEHMASQADLYISYNERTYALKKDRFADDDRLKILVVGNSFARDFINMVQETYDVSRAEIIYRPDFSDCVHDYPGTVAQGLLEQARVVVMASGGANRPCLDRTIQLVTGQGKRLFYVGLKHFGYNLNWLARLDWEERPNQFNPLLPETIQEDAALKADIPPQYYIPLLDPVLRDGKVPITDEMGRQISPDRAHLTRHGAIFFGKKALHPSLFSDVLPPLRD